MRRHRAHYVNHDIIVIQTTRVFGITILIQISLFKFGCFDLTSPWYLSHYSDVIRGAMAYQITSLTIVYSIVYSGVNQRKHQSSESLAFVWGIHRWSVNSPHKSAVTRKMVPFDDVIMFRWGCDDATYCFTLQWWRKFCFANLRCRCQYVLCGLGNAMQLCKHGNVFVKVPVLHTLAQWR